jgi:DNA polymerase-3 subunit epsilon
VIATVGEGLERYRRAPRPSLTTPWRAARFVVVDLETTGLDARLHEIVSFAAVPVRDGRVIVGEAVSLLVRPQSPPPPEVVRIHGIRSQDLRSARPIDDQLDLIAGSLAGSIVVAHAAWVERTFLDAALRRAGLAARGPFVDTRELGRAALRRRGERAGRDLPLGTLARAFNLPVHRPHHADGDALTTAQLFIALATTLERGRQITVAELAGTGAGVRRWLSRLARRSRR